MSGVYNMYDGASIDAGSLSNDLRMQLLAPNPSYTDELQQEMRWLTKKALNDPAAGFRFDFYPNPNATRPTPWLTNGILPYRLPAYQA